MFYETVEAINGNMVTRIKSSIFYWTGFACIPIGIFLLSEKFYVGAGLITFAAPCLLLYPLIRFLIGGKDSVVAVVATVVVEEVLKDVIGKSGKKRKK